MQERFPYAVLARVTGARKGLLVDGWYDDRLAEALLDSVDTGADIPTRARDAALRADRRASRSCGARRIPCN